MIAAKVQRHWYHGPGATETALIIALDLATVTQL
jgi:hypothetical protein